MEDTNLYSSPHFRIQQLAPGVYAAIHKEGGAAISNAGIIEMSRSTLIYDTFISPVAAEDLRIAAEKITAKPVRTVVNSHYHNDHIRGNQAFPGAEVITSNKTLALIKTAGMEELKWDQENSARLIQARSQALAQAQDEETRRNLAFAVDYFRVIAESLPLLELRLPDRTFDDRLILEDSLRRVEILSFGGGHTGDDVFLVLPQERIGFLADLMFVDCHPYLPDGCPGEWLRILDAIHALNLETLIPGHGPKGGSEDLLLVSRYIRTLQELTRQALLSGQEQVSKTARELPPPLNRWTCSMFYQGNIDFLLKAGQS